MVHTGEDWRGLSNLLASAHSSVVMHCSACFRDRRNTRLPVSMSSVSSNVTLFIPAHRLGLSSLLPHQRLAVQNVHLVQQNSPHPLPSPTINFIHNYIRYTHASIIVIVLYPSCTHTHHTPTHLRLSLGNHDMECLRNFPCFPTSYIPFSFPHAGTQETPSFTPL